MGRPNGTERSRSTLLDFRERGCGLKLIPSSGYYEIFKKEILCDLCVRQARDAGKGTSDSQQTVLLIT